MPDIQPAPALDTIAQRIFELRGQRAMLDADLAALYGVETRYIPRASSVILAAFRLTSRSSYLLRNGQT